jgi:hypothetical protein
MAIKFSVPMLDGSVYNVGPLLANGESNTKTAKSDGAGMGVVTKSLSFAPASVSGFNVCPSSSEGCRKGCLFTSGYARVHPRKIQPARIAKTRYMKLFPALFRKQLERELSNSLRTATRKGVRLAIRLNVLSDIIWEREFPGLIEGFPEIQFYDYTKHYLRMLRYVDGLLPGNYHLTFSWSGVNAEQCKTVLEKGGNVAVPFHKSLPASFLGFPVIDGDVTDLRFLDPQGGYIVGLKAKGDAKKDFTSGFVVSNMEVQQIGGHA